MVSNAAEAAAFVAQAHECGLARAGIMVEVLSAAICADETYWQRSFVPMLPVIQQVAQPRRSRGRSRDIASAVDFFSACVAPTGP